MNLNTVSDLPPRLKWTVEVLDVQPNERILEIGCGNGAALAELSKTLVDGIAVGVDRSKTAIVAARKRLEREIAQGKAKLIHVSLESVRINQNFDKAFTVNINAFWLSPHGVLPRLRQLLIPHGIFFLFYEPPSSTQLKKIESKSLFHLQEFGFEIKMVKRKILNKRELIGIAALNPAIYPTINEKV